MLKEFIAYLEEQVKNHSIYVWGAQGQGAPTISETWIRKMETTKSNANRAIQYWKKQCDAGYKNALKAFDCSGLGVYWLLKNKVLVSDTNANGLKGKCEKITKASLKKGDWVFRVTPLGRAYHIGYVVDDQRNVIEAMGRDNGVVKRSLHASGTAYWNYFGRPIAMKKEIEETKQPKGDDEMKILTKKAIAKISELYDVNGNREKGRYIAKNDVCKITNIMTDRLLIKVEYPISSGTRTAYLKSVEKFK